jgi:hypothetical protein
MPIVMRRMAVIGLVQGLALWALSTLVASNLWPAGQPAALLGLIYAAVAWPFAWYLTEDIVGLSPTRRRVIVFAIGIGMAILGAFEGWVTADDGGVPRPSVSVPACLALAFVALPLLVHARRGERGRWHWNYAALFQTAWRNVMVLAVALLLTGIFWGVLFAGAYLMSSIGLKLVLDLILRPWFLMPVTGVVAGCAIAVALARADTIAMLRRFCLSLNQAFLPLVLLFAVMWAIALPFTGVQALFETRMAGLVLLWFAALAINFANAARQDGLSPPPFTAGLRRVLSVAWLAMPVVVGVAAVAIYQRIAQYGWSAERVWSVFVLLMAAGYTLGYSLSVWPGNTPRKSADARVADPVVDEAGKPAVLPVLAPRGWMWSIDQTNVVMALVLCAGLIALSSPLADARRIAVDSQVGRLLNGKTSIEQFDFHYLTAKSGIYGTRALQALADGVPGHAQADVFSRTARSVQDGSYVGGGVIIPPGPSDDELRKRWRRLAGEATPSDTLVDTLLAHLHSEAAARGEDACLDEDTECLLWMSDLDGDQKPELVMVVDQSWRRNAFVYRWQEAPAQLSLAGQLDEVSKEWITGLSLGAVQLPPSPWRDIEAAGVRMRIVPIRK